MEISISDGLKQGQMHHIHSLAFWKGFYVCISRLAQEVYDKTLKIKHTITLHNCCPLLSIIIVHIPLVILSLQDRSYSCVALTIYYY